MNQLETVLMLIFFGILAVVFNGLGYRKGYFVLPRYEKDERLVCGPDVVICFGIYIGLFFFISYIIFHLGFSLANLFKIDTPALNLYLATILQLISGLFAIILFYSYARHRGIERFKQVLKRSSHPIIQDIGMGAMTYVISMPGVFFVNQLIEQITIGVYGSEGPKQNAVQFFQQTTQNPLLTIFALIAILFIAPFFEEFLFRGLLQTYLKQLLGTKAAILLSSICFAFFHFSKDQGVGNIALIPTLFVFALYLGFIYERQRSLAASITLHFVFNLVGVVRILI